MGYGGVKMADKKYWRCNVCNDIHYGMAGPELCPTCQNKDAYVEVTKEEAMKVMEG
jgi:rubrerythrin